MKQTLILIIGVAIVTIMGCSKSNNNSECDGNDILETTITLYNKPLCQLKRYVTGNWKLIYTDGGYGGGKKYYDSTYWELSDNRIKRIFPSSNGGVLIDTTINWIWTPIVSNGSVYSYILNYRDDRSYTYDYIIMKKDNDTLIISETGIDGFNYHFIKK